MDKFYFVMPAYNEAENIESVIKQWHPVIEKINEDGNIATLAIANDGSKDSTYPIMESLKKDYKYLDGRGETVLNLLGQIHII